MPERFDPLMQINEAKNVGSSTGGVTSSTPGKGKASIPQAFDSTANTGTTTSVKGSDSPTQSYTGQGRHPAGVQTFNPASV